MYSFKCECSFKFEKALKSTYTEDVKCPLCGKNSQKMPPKNVAGKVGEVTSIPKEIDLSVGKDANKKWEEYEERKQIKDKVRRETKSDWISRDLDGEYTPLTVKKDEAVVSGEEAANLRKEMWQTTKDPEIEKYIKSE